MPEYNGMLLPEVKITLSDGEIAQQEKKLDMMPMPLEAMIELSIYLKREMAKVDALKGMQAVLKGRIENAYQDRAVKDRVTCRTKVGMSTYSEGGEKLELIDRDTTVDNLTTEQLRISYKPDLKSLETILRPDEFERHVRRVPKDPVVTIRENKSNDYEEIDF